MRFLVNLQAWFFRVLFSLVIILSGAVMTLQFVDFSKVERHMVFLHFLKKKPERLKDNVWIGGFFADREFVSFLKSRNIDMVISLLDVDMKHERELLLREKTLFREFGIKVISVPLKPFIHDSRSVRKLEEILNSYRNVYIHSYLGRIRTKPVRRLIVGR